jgi:hypothetical protein
MNCDQSQPLLDAFADGELGWGTVRRVRRHLAGCAACAAELAEIRQMNRRVRAWQDVSAPAGLHSQIAAALPPAAVPASRRFLVRRTAVGMAGLAAATAAFVWLVPGQLGRSTIAFADVVKAMDSVNIVASVDEDSVYGSHGEVVSHYHYQTWTRRNPPAIAIVPIHGSYTFPSRSLQDSRGAMRVSRQGKFLNWSGKIDPDMAGIAQASLDELTQPLHNMELEGYEVSKTRELSGQSSVLDGQPVLKFISTMYNASTKIQRMAWVSVKTKRVVQVERYEKGPGKRAHLYVRTHILYDETPPSGIFDVAAPPRMSSKVK